VICVCIYNLIRLVSHQLLSGTYVSFSLIHLHSCHDLSYYSCCPSILLQVGCNMSGIDLAGGCARLCLVLDLCSQPPHLILCPPVHLLTFSPNTTPQGSLFASAPRFFLVGRPIASASGFYLFWYRFGVFSLC
jgi:hypothetical protein